MKWYSMIKLTIITRMILIMMRASIPSNSRAAMMLTAGIHGATTGAGQSMVMV